MSKILLTRKNGKVLTASWDGARVTELMFEEDDPGLRVGDIYLCKVKDVVRNLQAAFVEVKPGVLCFLSLTKTEMKDCRPGDVFPVVVEKEALKTKDPVVSRKLSVAGRTLVLVSDKPGVALSSRITDPAKREELKSLLQGVPRQEGTGFIVRTNAEAASPEEILREARSLAETYRGLLDKAAFRTVYSCLYAALPGWKEAVRDAGRHSLEEVVTDQQDLWEELSGEGGMDLLAPQAELRLYQDAYPMEKLYRLDHFLEQAAARRVWLKSGGFLVIDYTEAMTVIDVNTGKYDGGKKKEAALLQTNLEATKEIAFQLRLRNLSGIILVDFIDMEQEESREELMSSLARELSRDPCHARPVDMTALGLVEITRKKVRKPLHEQLRSGEEGERQKLSNSARGTH